MYPLARAAKFWGVPPWELAKQPIYWRDIANILESADVAAHNERIKRDAAINL